MIQSFDMRNMVGIMLMWLQTPPIPHPPKMPPLQSGMNMYLALHVYELILISVTCCAYSAATVVYGRFSFLKLVYEPELGMSDSPQFKEMSQRLTTEIERELYSFTLPGRFEVNVQSFVNRYTLDRRGCHLFLLISKGEIRIIGKFVCVWGGGGGE